MRVLLIDDEPLYQKLILPVIKKAGYELEYAKSGAEGLSAMSASNPDIVIVDLRLPDIDGFEILRRLRYDPKFSHIPVIIITGKDDLDQKLKAFDLGADDFLSKPFQPEELVARLGTLARRGKAIKIVQEMETDRRSVSTFVAVHSLRGGVGCSSIAVNLALAFQTIWEKPTLLIDAVLASGQVAMMLDTSPRATLEEYLDTSPDKIDEAMIDDLTTSHRSGINFISAPRYPIAVDSLTEEFWNVLLNKFQQRHDFIVVDTAHDFSDITIPMLNMASKILLMMAPEMASLRAAVGALNIYDRLGFSEDKIKVVLNNNSNASGIRQAQLEKALGRQIDVVIPYEPNEVMRAINFGEPFMMRSPEIAVSTALEDLAFDLSHDIHKNIPPAMPSAAWKRVTSRKTNK